MISKYSAIANDFANLVTIALQLQGLAFFERPQLQYKLNETEDSFSLLYDICVAHFPL